MDQSNAIKIEAAKTYGSGVLFAVFVGFSFLSLKQMVIYGNALDAIAYRYTFAMIALVFCLLFKIVKVDFRGKPIMKAIPAATTYVLFMLLQAAGLKFSTSIESGIIFAIIPVFAAVISAVFLKEKSTFVQTAFMMLSITALVLMILCGATKLHIDPRGTVLLLLSSLSLATNNVLMRYLRNTFSPLEVTTAIIVEGFVVLNIISIVWGLINGDLSRFFGLVTHPSFVIAGLYLAVPCTLVSAALMAYMTKRTVAVKASIFGNLSTAISIVAGVVFLKEPIYWYHILCSILIIVGVIGVSASKTRGGVKDGQPIGKGPENPPKEG